VFDSILFVTALVLGIGTVAAYGRTRDILHPMLFLGPLFVYGAVLDPWMVRHRLSRFFRSEEDVNLVLLLNLLAVTALVLGTFHVRRSAREANVVLRRRPLQDRERRVLLHIALVLAIWALAAYVYGIANTGGFTEAFSRFKGGASSGSGYINESMNLGLVAAVMVGLSRYRRGWTGRSVTLLAMGLLPNLVQGTFGGRRGPLFLALSCAMIARLITRYRTPTLWTLGLPFAAVLLAVAFVGSQRQHLYLGSDEAEVRWEDFVGYLTQEDVNQGNNFIYGAGFVLATRQSGQYTWGHELAVNLFVRPVPRQIWPRKYEDAGATWVTNEYPGLGHLSVREWRSAVGWAPLAGSSAISISDLFGEFGWGAIAAMYMIGRGFAFLHFRRRTRGGVWDLLYIEALILSIYLATQSFSAFYHRFLILAIPTVIFWRLYVYQDSRRVATHSSRGLKGRLASSVGA
jgi:hypothetical protein